MTMEYNIKWVVIVQHGGDTEHEHLCVYNTKRAYFDTFDEAAHYRDTFIAENHATEIINGAVVYKIGAIIENF